MSNISNYTRLELQRLKTKLDTSKKGHKLLKEKNDELIRNFLLDIKEYLSLKEEVENSLINFINLSKNLYIEHSDYEIKEKLNNDSNNILNVFIDYQKYFNINIPYISGEIKFNPSYNLNNSSLYFDYCINDLLILKDKLFLLATLENKIYLIINEIEKSKRRINALEYVIIKELEEDIKLIKNKISDLERSNTVRIMKSKDFIIKKKE